MIRFRWLGLLCAILFFTIAAQIDKTYRADRFDIDVHVQPDGSLDVEESVSFRFTGGPFSYVFRELLTDHSDGITDISAGVDGVAWPRGTGPGEVEISGSNPIEVMWHLSPTSDTTQNFTLSYTQHGVVRPGEDVDVLDWQALPDEYDYEIDNSRLTIFYPPEGRLLNEPEIRAGDATVQTETGRAIFDMQALSPGDPLVVRLSFAPGAITSEPPAWLAQQKVQNNRAWIWIAATAAVLIGGLFLIMRSARNNTYSPPKANGYIQKPPIDLPPAMAGYLANSTVGWHHGLATLFDLAGRGFIEIEQITEKSVFRSAEFAVTLLERPSDLKVHEQALIDLLFIDKAGIEQEVVTLSEMGRLITSSRWKTFTRTVEEEAGMEGFLDPSAKARKGKMIGWALAVMLLSLALFLAAFILQNTFGAWPLITVGAVFLIGIITAIVGASFSFLSQKGRQYASAFEPFHQFLKDVSKGKVDIPDNAYYEAYLPFATSYGLAEPWVKRQAKSDYQQIPSYFRGVEFSGGEMAAFVAVISAASNSGGAASAAAGAAGAAAAGGGASGAG